MVLARHCLKLVIYIDRVSKCYFGCKIFVVMNILILSLFQVMSLTLSHTLASSAGLMCPSTRRGLAAALKTVANLALCPFNIPLLIEHRITFFFETFLSLFIRMSKDQKYSETAVMSLLYVALRTLSNLVVEFTHDSMQSFQPTLPLLLELIRSSHQPSNTLLCLTFDTLSGLCRTPQNAARFYTLNGHTTVLYYLERISSGHHDHHLCQFLLRLIERQGAQCPVAFSTMQQQGKNCVLMSKMTSESYFFFNFCCVIRPIFILGDPDGRFSRATNSCAPRFSRRACCFVVSTPRRFRCKCRY